MDIDKKKQCFRANNYLKNIKFALKKFLIYNYKRIKLDEFNAL
jgi:hypothetical protein